VQARKTSVWLDGQDLSGKVAPVRLDHSRHVRQPILARSDGVPPPGPLLQLHRRTGRVQNSRVFTRGGREVGRDDGQGVVDDSGGGGGAQSLLEVRPRALCESIFNSNQVFSIKFKSSQFKSSQVKSSQL
jgi:hypothetical protein